MSKARYRVTPGRLSQIAAPKSSDHASFLYALDQQGRLFRLASDDTWTEIEVDRPKLPRPN